MATMTAVKTETAPAAAAPAASSAPAVDPATSPAPADGQLSLGEFADVNERRARSYSLLARLYAKEIDRALLDELRAMRFPVSTGNADVDEGMRLVAGYLSNVWDGTVQELAVDYVHCFIGSGMDAFSAAYPYESVYTSPKRLMMQEARDEVLAIYRSQGLDKAKEWKESEDHIAAECAFMAELATRTAKACRAGDEEAVESLLKTQLNFLSDHLYAWTGMMTADMRGYARTDLYRGLAAYTDGFLTSDRETLAGVLGVDLDAEEDCR